MGRVGGRPEDGKFRPVLEVVLRISPTAQPIPVVALVDSGADFTTIPVKLGEDLTGLPFDQIGRAGGSIVGMGVATPMRILDGVAVSYMGRVFATTILVGHTPRSVVGINDFMKAFDVRFYWSRKVPEFWVEPTQPPSATRTADPTIRPKHKRR